MRIFSFLYLIILKLKNRSAIQFQVYIAAQRNIVKLSLSIILTTCASCVLFPYGLPYRGSF